MKVGVVGAGMVGGAAANALVLRGAASEIVLIDRTHKRAIAEAEDISHATPFSHVTRVRAGEYVDLTGASVVILAAGVGQRPGETRLELLERNAAVFADILPHVLDADAGCDPDRRNQSGRRDDPDRDPALRAAARARDRLRHDPRYRAASGRCWAPTSGCRPNPCTPTCSASTAIPRCSAGRSPHVGGIPVEELARQIGRPLDDAAKARIDQGVRRAAYRIIEGKGATWHGIAGGLARIIQSIGGDENSVLTVSMLTEEVEGVGPIALSLPRVVGRAGVVRTLLPLLEAGERVALRRSAATIEEALAGRW